MSSDFIFIIILLSQVIQGLFALLGVRGLKQANGIEEMLERVIKRQDDRIAKRIMRLPETSSDNSPADDGNQAKYKPGQPVRRSI